jgi:molybdenum cofactor cytidylyltransferase
MKTKAPIGLVILAAGESKRLGEPKQLLSFQGQTLLRRIAAVGLASCCRPVIVVLGAYSQHLQSEVDALPIRIVCNPNWSMGMSTSIEVGITAMEEEVNPVTAIVLALCDQPLLDAARIDLLVQTHQETQKKIVVSAYNNTWGTPALFDRIFWPELKHLTGQRGAQKVALQHPDRVEAVLFEGGIYDVDTHDDYNALLATMGLSSSDNTQHCN